MEVHRGVEGHVAVEEGLSQERDEVAAHGEQDVGEHEGDAGGRAPRQDDAYAGRVGDALVVSRKGVVCRGKSTAAPAGFRQTGPSTSGGRCRRYPRVQMRLLPCHLLNEVLTFSFRTAGGTYEPSCHVYSLRSCGFIWQE